MARTAALNQSDPGGSSGVAADDPFAGGRKERVRYYSPDVKVFDPRRLDKSAAA